MNPIESLLHSYEVERPAPRDRPWVLLNLVVSADGHASIDGRVAELTSASDQRLFHHLRGLSDVILVGASTVRAEKYGPVRVSDAMAQQRLAAGRSALPALAIVSRSLDIDIDKIAGAGQPVVVLTCGAANASRRAEIARSAELIVAGDDMVDLRHGLAVLRERGARVVLCEGGAVLNGELAQAGLIDEVCVTVAPVFGGDPSTTSGLSRRTLRLDLQHAQTLDGNAFLRWLVV